jgi:hypothetical protein
MSVIQVGLRVTRYHHLINWFTTIPDGIAFTLSDICHLNILLSIRSQTGTPGPLFRQAMCAGLAITSFLSRTVQLQWQIAPMMRRIWRRRIPSPGGVCSRAGKGGHRGGSLWARRMLGGRGQGQVMKSQLSQIWLMMRIWVMSHLTPASKNREQFLFLYTQLQLSLFYFFCILVSM